MSATWRLEKTFDCPQGAVPRVRTETGTLVLPRIRWGSPWAAVDAPAEGSAHTPWLPNTTEPTATPVWRRNFLRETPEKSTLPKFDSPVFIGRTSEALYRYRPRWGGPPSGNVLRSGRQAGYGGPAGHNGPFVQCAFNWAAKASRSRYWCCQVVYIAPTIPGTCSPSRSQPRIAPTGPS